MLFHATQQSDQYASQTRFVAGQSHWIALDCSHAPHKLFWVCFQPYLEHQEVRSESLQAVVPAACPTRPAGYAGTVRGERTASLLSAQIPHTGRFQWSAHKHRSIFVWANEHHDITPQSECSWTTTTINKQIFEWMLAPNSMASSSYSTTTYI